MLQILAPPDQIESRLKQYSNMLVPNVPNMASAISSKGMLQIDEPINRKSPVHKQTKPSGSPKMRGKSELNLNRVNKLNKNLIKQSKQFGTIDDSSRIHASLNGPLPELKNQLQRFKKNMKLQKDPSRTNNFNQYYDNSR